MNLGCPICIGLSFLRRLFHFVAENAFHLYRLVFSNLQNQASKTVTLGNPPPLAAAQVLSPAVVEAERNDNEVGEDNKRGEEDTMIVVPEKRAPKKTVSINEAVEEINSGKKLKRRKKSKEKLLSSMEEEEQAEPPKRLKSILKVSSNVNDQFK
nr:Fibrous sheath CABYR-binding protein [Ipomoea batatas]